MKTNLFKSIFDKKKGGGNNLAFTLIELLVVMAIISLLSALVLNNLASARVKANETKIAEDLKQVRVATELYFVDNHDYPDNNNYIKSKEANASNIKSFANNNTQNTNKAVDWSKRLSFFIKTAEAASHTITPLCANFDEIAGRLVTRKYLSSIPVHPYDNDSVGVCYKAIKKNNTFAAFAVLPTQVNTTNTQQSIVNKRTGFIAGDTSKQGIEDLGDYIGDIPLTEGGTDYERDYPAGEDGGLGSESDLFGTDGDMFSIDEIDGMTDGADPAEDGLLKIIEDLLGGITPPAPPADPYAGCTGVITGIHPSEILDYSGGNPYGVSFNPKRYQCIYGYHFLINGQEGKFCGSCIAD